MSAELQKSAILSELVHLNIQQKPPKAQGVLDQFLLWLLDTLIYHHNHSAYQKIDRHIFFVLLTLQLLHQSTVFHPFYHAWSFLNTKIFLVAKYNAQQLQDWKAHVLALAFPQYC